MADEPRSEEQLTAEELEAEEAEQLPDRETMMILDPDPGAFPLPSDFDSTSGSVEAPDDRYEQ